jgi:hypothetical protein
MKTLAICLLSMLDYITRDIYLTDKEFSDYKEIKDYLNSIIGYYHYA